MPLAFIYQKDRVAFNHEISVPLQVAQMLPCLRMQQLIRPFVKRFERLVYSTYLYEYEGRYQQPSALLEHTIVQSNNQLASCRFTLAEKN